MKKNYFITIFLLSILIFVCNAQAQFHQNLSFNGTNSAVDCGSMPSVFENVSTYTVEARVKFNSFTQWGTVLCKRTNFERDVVIQCYDSTGQLGIAVSNGGYAYTFNSFSAIAFIIFSD